MVPRSTGSDGIAEARSDPEPIDLRQNVAVGSLLVSTVAYFTASGMSFPVLPRLVDEVVGGAEAAVGLAFAAFGFGLLAVRPWAAWLIDRFGRRPVIVVSTIVAAASQLAYVGAAQHSLALLLAARFMTGVGGSGLYVALATVATELPRPQRRSAVFSIFSACSFIGFAIGPLLGEGLYQRYGFNAVYYVAATIAVLPAILAFWLRETRPDDAEPKLGSLRTLLDPIGSRLGLATMAVVVSFMSFNAFVTDWSQELGAVSAQWVIFTFSVTALLCRLGSGGILDGDRIRVGTVALTVMIAGVALQGLATSQGWLYPAAVLLAAGMSFMVPLLILIGADVAPARDRARVVATIAFFNDMGSSFALPVLGFVAEEVGFRWMYAVVTGLAIGALVYFRSPAIAALVHAGQSQQREVAAS